MVEYETAFVDNISHRKQNKQPEKNHNVSIKEAWNNNKFQQTDFFPGTALRVYQARIFKEMLQEEPLFLKGFGLEASQYRIREKPKSIIYFMIMANIISTINIFKHLQN